MIGEFNQKVEQLLQGSVDMHLHAAPDPWREWRLDALQVAIQARDVGMSAIVLKSHEYPTAPLAHLINQCVPEIKTCGALVLNEEVGGLNPAAVETSGGLGAKVIWMPTFSSDFHRRQRGKGKPGISILDGKDKLLPEVDHIMEVIKEYEMVLATGHLSPHEIFLLLDATSKKGLKTIATHAYWAATIEEQKRMAAKGAFIEFCFLATMPTSHRTDPGEIVSQIRAIGAEQCILTTDFGWPQNPPPAEGMRMAIATMLNCGLDQSELELLIKKNPAKLLGLWYRKDSRPTT